MSSLLCGNEERTNMKTAGIVILIVGLLMTIYTGFTYVTQDKILDVGGLELTKDDHHTISWQPYVGIAAMVIGGVVLVLGRKQSLAT
jgi:drug/metabolite transporter (DMT)-like permease